MSIFFFSVIAPLLCNGCVWYCSSLKWGWTAIRHNQIGVWLVRRTSRAAVFILLRIPFNDTKQKCRTVKDLYTKFIRKFHNFSLYNE